MIKGRAPVFEICVDSPESALAAQRGGADRVELCDNLAEGGTTLSLGSIEIARSLLNIKLHIIVRPRGGDFLYSDIEFEIMKRDIAAAKRAGVDGVVFGILDQDGSIDKPRNRELVELSRPMAVTFHRAFDVCSEPFKALEDLVEIGVDRILTSGQHPTATEGTELIAKLIETAGDRISILTCGGLNKQNIANVATATAAREFHFTAFKDTASPMKFRNDSISMGGTVDTSEYTRRVTSTEIVREIIEAVTQTAPH